MSQWHDSDRDTGCFVSEESCRSMHRRLKELMAMTSEQQECMETRLMAEEGFSLAMADLLPERFEFEPFYEGGPRPVVTRKEDEFFDRHGDYIGHWSQLEENTTNGVFTMFDAWLDAGEE